MPDKKACFGSSLFNSGKPNTPESSKLLGEQHLQTASGRAIIRAVGGSILSLWVLLPEPTKGRLIYSLLGYI